MRFQDAVRRTVTGYVTPLSPDEGNSGPAVAISTGEDEYIVDGRETGLTLVDQVGAEVRASGLTYADDLGNRYIVIDEFQILLATPDPASLAV